MGKIYLPNIAAMQNKLGLLAELFINIKGESKTDLLLLSV